MNNLQQKEFELLKIFDGICKELKIEYFMVCGSALGAAKYGGFIPWDDDIDVALFRSDYELFISQAGEYLPSNIFLQNHRTDKNFPHIFSKLRDSQTTYIESLSSELDINHGVFIDIFPLDGYPSSKKDAKKLERYKNLVKFIQPCVFVYPKNFKKINIRKKILRFLRVHKWLYRAVVKLNDICSMYDTKVSEQICNHGNSWSKVEYSPKYYYGQGEWMSFEGLKVKVPQYYELYLTQKYGEWHKDLEESQKKGHHYFKVCDLNKSYVFYK